MKLLLVAFTLTLSMSSFASESCKLVETHYQAYVRCFCQVFELRCENTPNDIVYADDTAEVNCGDKKKVKLSECEAGATVEVLPGQTLYNGKNVGNDIGIVILGTARVVTE